MHYLAYVNVYIIYGKKIIVENVKKDLCCTKGHDHYFQINCMNLRKFYLCKKVYNRIMAFYF